MTQRIQSSQELPFVVRPHGSLSLVIDGTHAPAEHA
jgi:hypothetical protein